MTVDLLVRNVAGLSGTEYSVLVTTDMSKKLDTLFGFDYIHKFASEYASKLKSNSLRIEDIDEPEIFMNIGEIFDVSESPVRGLTGEITIPVSREAQHNFRSARALMVASYESEKVVDYFSGLAKQVGFFFALPYDEVIRANNRISQQEIQRAINEQYVRVGVTTRIDGNPLHMIEITNKFCPLEKRVQE
ncbi:MAG: hypothetical protein ACMXYD_05290 [Candidatus Woesearchaeota archaeon]